MISPGVLLRAARKSGNLTQDQLAQRTGVDQARVSRSEHDQESPRFATVDRLLSGSGHRLYAAPTRRDDAATAAVRIRARLERGDRHGALRHLLQLNDDLLAERGLVRGVLAVTAPESTGQKVWDAAIAALVSWRLGEEHVPLPGWVAEPSRRLLRSRVLRVDPADPAPAQGDVPEEFLRHGVLAWRDTFASV
ncbi:helix-turn-helix domain-containing protein [Rathayibacter sp. ZW T2_19]|uniref:Helix-turn-helix domain-containing protein n=1 Tax=Rathayibacter rubneri TaxID=2950106 RepID=A0A9X2IQT0_9MICO|nr:helix-turn-helix transcriptional regulator [Rathayibacter rubneri]MCM6761545.1 helix-turn-helix domain-containing protein [Rathayibacter rubneri]